jgi:signal transduction histidine kinase
MGNRPIKTLLVEDNPGDTRLIREMLAEAASTTFHLEFADRLQAGLERLAGGEIDVVLLDLGLPDSKGLETLNKAHAQAPAVPIVVLTGLDDEMLGVQAVKRGAQDYLVKGEVDGNLLIRTMRYAIERKQAEERERQLQLQLNLCSHLASVGVMAKGVAHEINNPLTSVIGFAEILTQKNIPEDTKQIAHIISDNAQRAASIVRRLLIFAHERKLERTYININETIETTLAMRSHSMETSNIKVTTQLDPELPWTMADDGQLQEAFLNIIINAEMELKLTHGRGDLLIKTETIENTIRVSFTDDGPGITQENLWHLFDPFFTTREVGKGTGLGLSICHGIITEHNGRIYAESELGRGATFVIELPIVAEGNNMELAEPTADDTKESA